MAEDRYTQCVAELAADTRLLEQLLEEHTVTDGGWCRAHQAHPERHPCSIRRLAEIAAGTRAADRA